MTRFRALPWSVLPLICLVTTAASAAEVLSVQATRHGAAVSVGLRIALNEPAPAIFRALLRYGAMGRYEPDLRAIHIETTADPNRVRLFLTLHTCVLLFCKTLRQEQIMTATPDAGGGVVQAQFVAASGAFSGNGRWVVAPCMAHQGKACMDVRIDLTPLFWVPPMIGPWLIRRKMYEQALHISTGLEQLAQQAARQAVTAPGRAVGPVPTRFAAAVAVPARCTGRSDR
ncbi:MAG TPA: hypothetical protein VHY19_00480 [Steroidobacteraceae bacterium]|jgi:hypothetical protein|nr:hypothetical protein [Steroidobacteraceae bacterium]